MLPPSTPSPSQNQQDFALFYDTYAPKLWGIILEASLPGPQSETIFIRTLIRAWNQLDQPMPDEPYFLTRLLGLAYREGLPIDCLNAHLKSNPH